MCVTQKNKTNTASSSSWASPFSGIDIELRQKRCWVFYHNFSLTCLPFVAQRPSQKNGKRHFKHAFGFHHGLIEPSDFIQLRFSVEGKGGLKISRATAFKKRMRQRHREHSNKHYIRCIQCSQDLWCWSFRMPFHGCAGICSAVQNGVANIAGTPNKSTMLF